MAVYAANESAPKKPVQVITLWWCMTSSSAYMLWNCTCQTTAIDLMLVKYDSGKRKQYRWISFWRSCMVTTTFTHISNRDSFNLEAVDFFDPPKICGSSNKYLKIFALCLSSKVHYNLVFCFYYPLWTFICFLLSFR